jgi:hypothetical protein
VYDLRNNAIIEKAYRAWLRGGKSGNNNVVIKIARKEVKNQEIDGEPDIQDTDNEEIDATVYFPETERYGNLYYQITADNVLHQVDRINLETKKVTYRGGKRKSRKSKKSRKSRKMRKSKRIRTKRN